MSVHAKSPYASLDILTIVDQALLLMHEIGIDALSTRRLADHLGVKGPALYWHFRNKEALLAHMCERLFALSLDRAQGGDWQSWLRSSCLELRATLGRITDGARLLASAEWTDASKTDLIARIERPLIESGMDRETAMWMVGVVNSFTLGWTTSESKADHRSFMASQFDIDAAFARGLDAVLYGLAASLQPGSRGRS